MKKRPMLIGMVVLLFAGSSLARAEATEARPDAVVEKNGMVLVLRCTAVVGTTYNERIQLARRYDCDPTWLNDDLPRQTRELESFWIDRHPVTNAQYLAFVRQTGSRNPWLGGAFSPDQADQPVVNITFPEASRYAEWAGKRLPTAIEWQAALGARGLFPWGDEWPGPVNFAQAISAADDPKTGIASVGTDAHGRAATGMKDFATLVCEWTTTRQDKVVPHYIVKGTSWLHRDPVNFRANAGSFVPEGFSSVLIGFRCALDATKEPAILARELPAPAPSMSSSASPPPHDNHSEAGRISLRRGSRDLFSFQIAVPELGELSFFAPETVRIDDVIVHSFLGRPQINWGAVSEGLIEYSATFGLVQVGFRIEAKDDYVDQICVIHNGWIHPVKFSISSCMRLEKLESVYDLEAQRTYLLNGVGEFISLRHLPRSGDCVRWVAASEIANLGGLKDRALIATESRDGRFAVGCGRADAGSSFQIQENTWFHCFHVEPQLSVASNETRRIRQRMYFVKGGLDALKDRFALDAAALRNQNPAVAGAGGRQN